jgi:hypothetical protein
MAMPVDRQPFVLFPPLDCADGSLQVGSDLLPGTHAIVSIWLWRIGDAMDSSFSISLLSGTLLSQVYRPEEKVRVSCRLQFHSLFSPQHVMRTQQSSILYFFPRACLFGLRWPDIQGRRVTRGHITELHVIFTTVRSMYLSTTGGWINVNSKRKLP